jgi:hypothetical protein
MLPAVFNPIAYARASETIDLCNLLIAQKLFALFKRVVDFVTHELARFFATRTFLYDYCLALIALPIMASLCTLMFTAW